MERHEGKPIAHLKVNEGYGPTGAFPSPIQFIALT